MAAMAVIVFVALFFFKAGYGYLSSSNWGPKISNKLAWVLMEAPAFVFLLYYTVRYSLSGRDTGNSEIVLYIMAGLYLLHYFQRSFIFPLMMRGKSTMPIAIMLMGLVFNTLNAYLIGGWLYSEAPAGMYGTDWLTSPQFIIGTVIFFTRCSLSVADLMTGLEGGMAWLNLVGLAILPTIVSTATLAIATRNIGATKASVLGVFEPITAILVGTVVFGEALTTNIMTGILISVVAVTFMIMVTKR